MPVNKGGLPKKMAYVEDAPAGAGAVGTGMEAEGAPSWHT